MLTPETISSLCTAIVGPVVGMLVQRALKDKPGPDPTPMTTRQRKAALQRERLTGLRERRGGE